MTRCSRIACALFALLLATGCTTASLEKLRKTEFKGSAFQTELARQYLNYADAEARQYDWIASKHFAEKGLTVAYGNDIDPDAIGQWNVPETVIPELERARGVLLGALTPANKSGKPAAAAQAQYYFDCWLEQQEDGWQTEDIEACRQGFFSAINALGAPQSAEPVVSKSVPLVLSTSYIIFFDAGRHDLNAVGRKILDGVIADLRKGEGYEVVLNGHADRTGDESANLALSQKRVKAVREALIAGGIPANSISDFAFGESDNRTQTPDGKPEGTNRRVEIFINQPDGQ